jgi:hypothetical protein
MNERIKSFAIECAGQLEWDGPTPESYTFTPDEITRFANFIVNECCRMMVDLEIQYPANLTALEIKKHFGVES